MYQCSFVTYIVLIPHDVQECVKWQVKISSAEACECAEDATSEEHIVQVTLSVGEELLDLLSWILLLAHIDVV